MTNFQSVRQQMKQDILSIVSDEGVFCIGVDIVMNEPEAFKDLFPILGIFHFGKFLLQCTD